jgi:hypothetical protein
MHSRQTNHQPQTDHHTTHQIQKKHNSVHIHTPQDKTEENINKIIITLVVNGINRNQLWNTAAAHPTLPKPKKSHHGHRSRLIRNDKYPQDRSIRHGKKFLARKHHKEKI